MLLVHARTGPNALPKTIRMNVRALLDLWVLHAPKISKNVRQPNPAYMDSVSTRMDLMRKL